MSLKQPPKRNSATTATPSTTLFVYPAKTKQIGRKTLISLVFIRKNVHMYKPAQRPHVHLNQHPPVHLLQRPPVHHDQRPPIHLDPRTHMHLWVNRVRPILLSMADQPPRVHKQDCQIGLAIYAIKNWFHFRQTRTIKNSFVLSCHDTHCDWRIFAKELTTCGYYTIKKAQLEHHCPLDQGD